MEYTKENTQMLVETYLAASDKESVIEDLAEIFEKPKKSIIAKLSKEKVYQKKTYRSKLGTIPVSKKEIIANIATKLNADLEKLQGLEKSSKMALEYLLDVLTQQHTRDSTPQSSSTFTNYVAKE